MGAQYLYPAYESIFTMLKEKPSSTALTQWSIYWIICVMFSGLEQSFLYLLIDYFPLYFEMKALVFIWLVHPKYLGAAWLWYAKFKAAHEVCDKQYYDKILQGLGPLGKEPKPS